MTTKKTEIKATGGFNLKAAEAALYAVIESEDADLAESIEAPEDGGPSRMPELTQMFVRTYLEMLS